MARKYKEDYERQLKISEEQKIEIDKQRIRLELYKKENTKWKNTISKLIEKFDIPSNPTSTSKPKWWLHPDFFTIIFTASIAFMAIMQFFVMEKQNDIIKEQNTRIEQQSYLAEGERISELNLLLNSLLDNIDKEVNKQTSGTRRSKKLSASITGRLAALSHYLKPYYYFEGDTISSNTLSAERGLLLTSLLNYNLSCQSLDSIFQHSNFQQADLKNINLKERYLKSINLQGANLRGANLSNAILEKANLLKANLRGTFLLDFEQRLGSRINLGIIDPTNLENCNLTGAILEDVDARGTNLIKSNLTDANLKGALLNRAYLQKSILIGADFLGANLKNARLDSANLSEAKNLTFDQLLKVKSLYKTIGIPDSMRIQLEQKKEALFIKRR